MTMPPASKRPRAPHQLPPGRHGLPRSFVVANQRDRILDAVAVVVSLAGYAAMSVEDIVVTAGVSRRTFYDHFKSKEDAFLAAYDAVAGQLVARVRAAFEAAPDFAAGVRDCLSVFLTFVASEPRFAEMCIVEAMSAGPEAVGRRNAAMQAFTALIESGAGTLGADRPRPPELTAEMLVGGIFDVIYTRVVRGETEELPALAPDLAYLVMVPYLGEEAARREASGPGRKYGA
jgi:AcrR family transcriptional regulator